MSPKSKRLARRLLKQNRGTRSITPRSWRVIAHEDYNDKINHATLCQFAKADGEWIPKDIQLQITLGLKHQRKVKHHPPCLFDMATNALRDALTKRESMPPVDPRIIKQFVKLGWLTRSAR